MVWGERVLFFKVTCCAFSVGLGPGCLCVALWCVSKRLTINLQPAPPPQRSHSHGGEFGGSAVARSAAVGNKRPPIKRTTRCLGGECLLASSSIPASSKPSLRFSRELARYASAFRSAGRISLPSNTFIEQSRPRVQGPICRGTLECVRTYNILNTQQQLEWQNKP